MILHLCAGMSRKILSTCRLSNRQSSHEKANVIRYWGKNVTASAAEADECVNNGMRKVSR
jgi:hypothetical protein